MSELRPSEASRYTALETPIFTCLVASARRMVDLAEGLRGFRTEGPRSRAMWRRANKVLVGGVDSPVRSRSPPSAARPSSLLQAKGPTSRMST